MTREEEIRARLDKATPGPWTAVEDELDGEFERRKIYRIPELSGVHESYFGPNNQFISNAPNDIDYLLKENQRLRGALEEMSRMSENNVEEGYTETDELIAEGFAHGVKWMASIARQALEGETK